MIIHCTVIFSFLFEIFPYKSLKKNFVGLMVGKQFKEKREKVEKTSKRPVFC